MADKTRNGLATIDLVGGPCCGEIYQSDYSIPQEYFSVRLVTDIRCEHGDHDTDESRDGVLVADPLARWFTYQKSYQDAVTCYWIFVPRDPQVQP
ncbi:hypothetical protein [Pseudarthrobacter niigatensis]|uniref:Uncharacterized protein n=1 Tax=Pseudarthrobacter niigatensis TaxID=369935 RepID=A0AAJ1WEH5_9MICC|nr:hypothetical protein [Pseudarthrobacter niigatensis]MDQ0144972.1 hypothetical protein [Pseudarthrobacter niigatensis]MDQ0264409.1 hypothetical protein [Pseudarthrobacter niigatensis]